MPPVRDTIQSFAVSKFEGVSDYMSTPAVAASEKLVRPVMPELDSLRGVAILLVLFFHGFNYQGAIAHFSGLPRLFIIAATTGWTGVYCSSSSPAS